MNAARAKEAIDRAADDDMEKLFDYLRVNELSEDQTKAIEQFTVGVTKLNQDIELAKSIIDKVFTLV